MQSLKRNKQKMYYSQPADIYTRYDLDDDGDIITYESGGVSYPADTGEKIIAFSEPTEFWGNISTNLTNAVLRAFGKDESENFATLIVSNGTIPLKIGARIWKKSEATFKDIKVYDNGETITLNVIDENSADFVVKGIADEGLNYDKYYLQRLNKED